MFFALTRDRIRVFVALLGVKDAAEMIFLSDDKVFECAGITFQDLITKVGVESEREDALGEDDLQVVVVVQREVAPVFTDFFFDRRVRVNDVANFS